MNIQDYISSGIIEAYAAGCTTEAEARELEQLAAQHPEIRAALDDASRVLEQYATAHAAPPPAGIRQKIRQSLDPLATGSGAQQLLSTQETDREASRPVQVPVSTISFWKYATAATVVLLVVSAAANMYLMKTKKEADTRIVSLEKEHSKMAFQRDMSKDLEQKFRDRLRALVSADIKSFPLKGLGSHLERKAILYWNSRTGQVYLSINNLPAPPEGKQYQLWAIVDGKPVDAGMYDYDSNVDFWTMKVIAKAEMFAITVEDLGGSPTPTLDQMVVAGKPG